MQESWSLPLLKKSPVRSSKFGSTPQRECVPNHDLMGVSWIRKLFPLFVCGLVQAIDERSRSFNPVLGLLSDYQSIFAQPTAVQGT
jgi:hypothetical protein